MPDAPQTFASLRLVSTVGVLDNAASKDQTLNPAGAFVSALFMPPSTIDRAVDVSPTGAAVKFRYLSEVPTEATGENPSPDFHLDPTNAIPPCVIVTGSYGFVLVPRSVYAMGAWLLDESKTNDGVESVFVSLADSTTLSSFDRDPCTGEN